MVSSPGERRKPVEVVAMSGVLPSFFFGRFANSQILLGVLLATGYWWIPACPAGLLC